MPSTSLDDCGRQTWVEISTSSIRISCVVQESDVETAVRALHAAFELDKV